MPLLYGFLRLPANAQDTGRILRGDILRMQNVSLRRPFALAAFLPCGYGIGASPCVRQLAAVDAPPPDRLGSAWRINANGREVDVFVGPGWPQPCIERAHDVGRTQEMSLTS